MFKRNFKKSNPRKPRFSSKGQRGRGFKSNAIDISLFINKSVQVAIQEAPQVQLSFQDLAIHNNIKQAVLKRGFKNPTPIQEKTIPLILDGKDVIGLANTGTGKTGAFLIPMIHKIMADRKQKLLIVVPTRELALQIEQELVEFTRNIQLNSAVIVGGARIQPQVNKLRANPSVIIGTPGRIKDLIQRKFLNLSLFNNVVLDEADRMLDMGFIPDIKLLLSLVNPERQTLLFSATLSRDIESLVNNFLKNPVKVSLKTQETSAQVEQDVVRVSHDKEKIEVLHDLLAQKEFQKILIFTRTKFGAEKLSKTLYTRGFKSESIHGNKSHSKRQSALKKFKENYVEILVATDIAARGLDIPDVSHVINYDLPATYEDYIHRIGRTGRADKRGKALTFIG